MSKITFDLPESYIFETTIDVRITDLNYGNHVGNDSILTLVHEARVRFLTSKGFSELDCGGAGIIMKDAALQFKKQLRYGDSVKVEVAVVSPSKIGCSLIYKMTHAEDESLIAYVKTGIVFYSYETEKLSPMPAAFKAAFLGE